MARQAVKNKRSYFQGGGVAALSRIRAQFFGEVLNTNIVQSIVLDSKIASPATIHKCLATLDRTGFLSFEVDPEDARRRVVSPTAKATKTLDALSRRVAKWARQQRA